MTSEGIAPTYCQSDSPKLHNDFGGDTAGDKRLASGNQAEAEAVTGAAVASRRMPPRMPPEVTTEQHSLVSDSLGLPAFPVDTEPSSDVGNHVMGVVVIAWLTRHALARWGAAWAQSGSLNVRFRSHLTTGLPLTITVVGDHDAIDLNITDLDDTVYATATATRPDNSRQPFLRPSPAANSPQRKALPRHDQLADRIFTPLTFEFDAARDLAFVERLPDRAIWRHRGWAHPAWLASATNALVRRNVDFGTPGYWTNAGVAIQHHAPIADGATITLTGGIDELFDRGRHRFAVAGITAWVDDQPAASLRNTFIYQTHDGQTD